MQLALFGLGLLLGRRAQVLDDAGRATARRSVTPAASRRIPRTKKSAPGYTGHNEVVRVVFDPQAISLRGTAAGVLGIARPDAGHAPGQRRRHAVPFRHLCLRRGAAARPRKRARQPTARGCARRATRPITTEILPRRSSTSPRTTTSSTWRRIPAATAGSAGLRRRCPVGLPQAPRARPRAGSVRAAARPGSDLPSGRSWPARSTARSRCCGAACRGGRCSRRAWRRREPWSRASARP